MTASNASGGTFHGTITGAGTAETVTMDVTGGNEVLIVNRDATNPLFVTFGDNTTAPVTATATAFGAKVVPPNGSRLFTITVVAGKKLVVSVLSAGTGAYDVELIG